MSDTLFTSLKVSWKLNQDTHANSHKKTNLAWKSQVDTLPHPREAQLSLPEGTIAVLNDAFSKKLTRGDRWQLSHLNDAQKKAHEAAAKIFKRGVPIEDNNTPSCISKAGEYQITTSESFHCSRYLKDGSNICSETIFFMDSKVYQAHHDLHEIPNLIVFESSESQKNLDGLSKIMQAWDHRFEEAICIGGGILCDMVGFAAYLKEKPVTFVPSTLLAMVDACVGGKTGVNFPPYGKNQVGAFYFPKGVLICKKLLDSLDTREWICGWAEYIKHAFLGAEVEVNLTSQNNREISNKNLYQAIKFKADIIQKDPEEHGIRSILNFGHTLAHGLEGLAQKRLGDAEYAIKHGEAVGIGMAFANFLSHKLGFLPKDSEKLMLTELKQAHLIPNASSFLKMTGITPNESWISVWKDLEFFLLGDKKRTPSSLQDKIPFVLLKERGEVLGSEGGEYIHLVPIKDLEQILSLFFKKVFGIFV